MVSLDDFQVILGVKFMHMAKMVPMFLNSLYLIEVDDPYMILVSKEKQKTHNNYRYYN